MPVNNFDFEKADGIIKNVQDMAVGRAPISAQKIFDYVSVMQKGFGIGSGLHFEVETGELTLDADTQRPSIAFVDDHGARMPVIAAIYDADNTYDNTYNTMYALTYQDFTQVTGVPMQPNTVDNIYALVSTAYRSNSDTALNSYPIEYYLTHPASDTGDSSIAYPRYWVKPDGFTPGVSTSSQYYRAGRTYKWIVIWFV